MPGWEREKGGGQGQARLTRRAGRGLPLTTDHAPAAPSCFLCSLPAVGLCTWCGVWPHCSQQHQRVHRPQSRCLPFRVSEVAGRGRGLLATRDIRPRETVLVEMAALTGPSLHTGPVCPACLAPLAPPFLPCSACGLPVCSPACQDSPAHRPECKLLQSG